MTLNLFSLALIMVSGGANDIFDTDCIVEIFITDTNKWSCLPSITSRRGKCPGVIVHEVSGRYRIILFGGYNNISPLDSCEYLDIGDNDWTDISSVMSTSRRGLTATLLDHNTVVICGGSSQRPVDEANHHHLRSCEQFDLTTHAFSQFPDMIRDHAYHAAIRYADSIVIFDNFNYNKAIPGTNEIFDRIQNKWMELLPCTLIVYVRDAAVINNNIYAVGQSVTHTSLIEIFDGTSWSYLTFLPTEGYCTHVTSFENRLVLLGEQKNELTIYDPITTKWSYLSKIDWNVYNMYLISF